uniref:WWE domain-containing protein n=1 Tax=Haptolina brevifila TaxID=156173 RepID=A0A7S2CD80_9EUKA|mmetsp:Transcript_23155/g.46338  ORF Transcript_23155/g.46338 Transcript_23155/m.46338 type:complete len:713 (+) Transcript_23155:112-2250(+)
MRGSHSSFAYEDDSRGTNREWALCDSDTSLALSRALRRGQKTVDIRIGRNKYEFDLESMTQRNVVTNVKRKVRKISPTRIFLVEGDQPGEWRAVDSTVRAALLKAENEGKTAVRGLKVGPDLHDYDLAAWTQRNTAAIGAGTRKLRAESAKVYAYEDGSRWWLLNDDLCFALTQASRAGKSTLRHTVGVHKHTFDLVALTQTNETTQSTRRLRVVSAPDGGVRELCGCGQGQTLRGTLRSAMSCRSADGSHSKKLRRHALLLLVSTSVSFTCILISGIILSLTDSGNSTRLLLRYGNSFSFIGCAYAAAQSWSGRASSPAPSSSSHSDRSPLAGSSSAGVLLMFTGAVGSKVAICRSRVPNSLLALHIRKLNALCAVIMGCATLVAILEGVGAIGSLASIDGRDTPSVAASPSPVSASQVGQNGSSASDTDDVSQSLGPPTILSSITCVGLVMATLLHANLALQASRIIAAKRRHKLQRNPKADRPEKVIVVVDDGTRVHLKPQDAPADNHVYVMYHGTRPEYAYDIEKYGFLPSRDGMLGAGVYLSRDINKAAHYPLDVPACQQEGRTILECLVDVGKVKRIDQSGQCVERNSNPLRGHGCGQQLLKLLLAPLCCSIRNATSCVRSLGLRSAMMKTWSILGYDTAWVPANCGVTPSGLEEDCICDASRIRVLRRVQIKTVSSRAASKTSLLKGLSAKGRSETQTKKQQQTV